LDFYLENNSDAKHTSAASWKKINNNKQVLYYKCEKQQLIEKENYKILIIGDYWSKISLIENDFKHLDPEFVIKNIKGNFYYFIIYPDKVLIVTGFLSLCPVFYSEKYGFATSSFKLLTQTKREFTICERFILETFLFNYAFFDSTIYDEVKLLSVHSCLLVNERTIKTEKFWELTELFVNEPSVKKSDRQKLVGSFIETIEQYVPDKNATISFTSGFDGRTIVSAALSRQKKFKTFSYGKTINDDVYIPKDNAKELGLSFEHIDAADDGYIKDHFYSNAAEMTIENGGFNGFLYPHFLFMAKHQAASATHLITGYGGSELLRSTHIMGAITSKALYDVITLNNAEELKNSLMKNASIGFINTELVARNIDQLIADLIEYKNSIAKHNSLNKKLYSFLLSETLRKVFGPWMFSQLRYIKVRTPFLDYDFVKSVFKTNLAGVYNDFYTKNPVKRFKGQLLYALIIKKTNSVLSGQLTGKGYKPKDLLSISGKIKMIYPFISKRLKRKIITGSLDNLSIISGLKHTISQKKVSISMRLFNETEVSSAVNRLNEFTPEKTRDALLSCFSISLLLNEK